MLSINIFGILSHQNIALYGINGRDALSYDIAYRDVRIQTRQNNEIEHLLIKVAHVVLSLVYV